ncbi:MAG: hypothetical protein SFW07_01410 [Gammaproteobacteria bacterium]|nr:hypothetical protein [Gammaproteobacteria bacterium]
MNEALIEVKDETALFCLDADGTIIDGHTHNIIWDASKENRSILTNPEEQWNLVKHLPPIGGDSQAWRTLFHTLIKDGHSVAIVSFSSFGKNILPRYLHEIIELEKDFIEKNICVVSFLPEDQSTKDLHIQHAKEKTGRQNIPANKIILCDDRDQLVWDAIHKAYAGIFATKNGAHIQVLLDRSKTSKLPQAPYLSPRGESSSSDSGLSALLDGTPSPRPREPVPHSSPKTLSSASEILKRSPARAANRRSSSPGCSLESSGEFSNDILRSSFERVKII